MKKLVVLVLVSWMFWITPAMAQQVSNVGQGSLLQSGSGGFQQTPGGFQGSTPQIFSGGVNGPTLNQSPLSLVPTIADTAQNAETATAVPGAKDTADAKPKVLLGLLGATGLCSILLGYTVRKSWRQT